MTADAWRRAHPGALPALMLGLGLLVAACSDSDDGPAGPPPGGGAIAIAVLDGDGQAAAAGEVLADPLRVIVREDGQPAQGVSVDWSVIQGSGAVSPTSSVTNADGVALAVFTLGSDAIEYRVRAAAGEQADTFTAYVRVPQGPTGLRVLGGGNNVPDRYSSDLWVHGEYAYTGTWGSFPRNGNPGNQIRIWRLDAAGAPTEAGSVTVPGVRTVSDVEVSADGRVLMVSGEPQSPETEGGLYLYDLTDPAVPVFTDSVRVSRGLHTATIGEIGGRRYAFAAKNPAGSAMMIFDITDPSNIVRTASVPVPDDYAMHDSFVRDGLVFVCAWNTGLIIYDVGNGMAGGTPSAPREVSRIVPSANGVPGGPAVHNAWWFHSPSGEKRYLFLGQEGPGQVPSRSSGDIHVIDVSDLRQPREVAFFHLDGAGAHNFWMDETAGILYAAYYNGGVVALDVNGTLTGDLADRLIGRSLPGGPGNTYVWGVQLAGGSLYAIDMITGLWQLAPIE